MDAENMAEDDFDAFLSMDGAGAADVAEPEMEDMGPPKPAPASLPPKKGLYSLSSGGSAPRKPLGLSSGGAKLSGLSRPSLGGGLKPKGGLLTIKRPSPSVSSAVGGEALADEDADIDSLLASLGAKPRAVASGGAGGGAGDDGDGDADVDGPLSQKAVNTSLMRQGDVEVRYAPVLPCLTVPDRKAALYRPFKLPRGLQPSAGGTVKRLGARMHKKKLTPPQGDFKRPGPLDQEALALLAAAAAGKDEGAEEEEEAAKAPAAPVVAEPAAFEPLVLWKPSEEFLAANPGARPISVDPILCRFLREHQREGVQFVFDCIHGLKPYGGNGCILADDVSCTTIHWH